MQGSNVGVQVRKLYNPEQFPGASVLPIFDRVFGPDRRGVCTIGVEANSMHTPYLSTLNSYFQRKGYQALILTEVAASTTNGKATFHMDHGSPSEWGASLSQGAWQRHDSDTTNEATVDLLDVAGFVAEVVRSVAADIRHATGARLPIAMKLDVEGEEYAILPAMVVTGTLCDLRMVFMEPHAAKFRRKDYTGMTLEKMERIFAAFRNAAPSCKVEYTHLDDETYLHGDKVPLPP
jgi:hypothetical protein